jgi:hypothetical protein
MRWLPTAFPLAEAEQALRAVTGEGTIKPIIEPGR